MEILLLARSQVKANMVFEKYFQEKDQSRVIPRLPCMMHLVGKFKKSIQNDFNTHLAHLESRILKGLSVEANQKAPLEDDDNDEEEDVQETGTPITKATKPTERILFRTKLLFGSRSKSGYHRKSLKSIFIENRATTDSFITDIG